MFKLFQKKINYQDLTQKLAMRLHEDMGDTEDSAREAFGLIAMPLDGYGFDAAMEQVRFAQVEGLCLALGRVVDRSDLLKKIKTAMMESCFEVGYLREGEMAIFTPHAILYDRVLNKLGSGDWERDCALLGIQFSDFLVANRDPALVELGTSIFLQANDLVSEILYKRKVV